MTKKTRSMRGEEVDFDLLDIKSKIQKTDKPLDVKTREDFVHMKRRRRGGAKIDELLKRKQKALEGDSEVETKKDTKESTTTSSKKTKKKAATKAKDVDASEKETPKKRKIVKKD